MSNTPIYESFHPDEKYTTRIKNILTEYPDGSQILREILQNSDDAKSSVQIFILNHKTYSSEKLCDPKLERYQGPALLSANDSIFQPEDFKSLVSLANSMKIDKYDKIGVMGIGFNSIFHISDVSSIISGSSYVFIDPHERKYCDVPTGQRGFKVDFLKHDMFNRHPDQFEPFLIEFIKSKLIDKNPHQFDNVEDGFYNGTIFRYPLRTSRDADESEISHEEYKAEQIKNLFDIFFNIDNISCLLFLKHIEKILFFELKENANTPELLYEIGIDNVKEVFRERKLLAENIMSTMLSTTSQDSFESIYKMKFLQKAKRKNIKSEWLIVNYISDTNDEKYIKFKNHIRDCKFIPIVGLAARVDNIARNKGKLYCFLPLPDNYDDFSISINGCFAVSKNRRHLEISMDEDLAPGDMLRLKGAWNRYLFEKAIPEAWKKLLTEIIKIRSVSYEKIYTFWPLPVDKPSRELDNKSCLWKNLLQNVINRLETDLGVFRGPSGYLSINDGYLIDKDFRKSSDLSRILEKLGFPIFVEIPEQIVVKLKDSFKNSLKCITPDKVCNYLKKLDKKKQINIVRLNRSDKLLLLEYILGVNDVSNLHGLPLLPVKNGTFTTFEPKSCPKTFYIVGKAERTLIDEKLFESIIDDEIDDGISSKLKSYSKNVKDINIQTLSEHHFVEMLKKSLKGYSDDTQEIPIGTNEIEWIYDIWDHLQKTNRNLSRFEDLHLLPIIKNNGIHLRKLKATPKCLCNLPRYHMIGDMQHGYLIELFKLLGSTFIDIKFEKLKVSTYDKLKNYLIELDDVKAVILSFGENHLFPSNITKPILSDHGRRFLIKYFGSYLQRQSFFDNNLIEVLMHFPIFNKVKDNQAISINSLFKTAYYLLPEQDERSYGYIISPDCTFLKAYISSNAAFILEKILKVKRLDQKTYWKDHVIQHLKNQRPDIKDQLITKLFERWEIIAPFRNYLSEIPFVLSSSSFRKMPKEIFDPDNSQIKDLFFEYESVFPTGKYLDREYLYKLRQLGMKNSMTIEDVVNRLNVYAGSNTNDRYSRSLHLLRYIDDNFNDFENDESFCKKIKSESWIPILKQKSQKIFLKASECKDQLHQNLVSYVIPVVQYQIKNNDLRRIFGWNDDPPIMKIIEQLLYLTDLINQEGLNIEIGDQIYKIYDYLNKVVSSSNNNIDIDLLKSKLSGKKWIFNDDKLYSSEEIVFSSIIQSNTVTLSNRNKNNYSKLFVVLGVAHEQNYFELLKEYKFSSDKQKYIIDMIEHLSHTETEDRLKELLVPNMNKEMVPCKTLFYDDMDTRVKESDKDFNVIAHPAISRDVAKKLKLRNFSEEFLKGRIDFVKQNDNVTATFLKTILEKFDQEEIVFQEFLKNADDAEATQFCIILDESQYSDKLLLREDMKCWQGPAIWIYNDSEFSHKDLESLNNIGRSDKGANKIGKSGLGFASCYHFTDMPQILSGTKIIFFDPQRKIFSIEQCYGSIFDFEKYKNDENHIMKAFKDQFEPYLKLEGCGFKVDFNKKFNGTLLRLPLRTIKSPISDKVYTTDNVWQNGADIIDRIENLLDVIKKDAISELIFLRNVQSIKTFRKRDNVIKPLWEVEIKEFTGNRKSLRKKPQILKFDVQYIQYSSTNISKTTKWLMCAEKKDNKHLWNAIATIIPEKQTEEIFNGKFYSYLSLLNSSELPVIFHSNGWELSLNKRSLALDSEKNTNILNNISELHVNLLEELTKIEHQKNDNYQIISQLWPIPEIENDTFKIKEYGKKVLERLCEKNSEIFWSPCGDGKYVSLKNSIFINDETPENIVDFLNRNNYSTVKIKPDHLNEFKEKSGYQQVSPQFVRDILKNNESILDSSERFSLLKYILEDKNYGDLENIALVPLFGNKFGSFATEKNYIIATLEQQKLFPKVGLEYFIPVDLLKTSDLYEIFSKNEFLKATNIQFFGEPTIRRFLQQELHPISERDWNPSASTIPNQEWLSEIWSYIINNSLSSYTSFPLLEVYDPNKQDQHQLISLENAANKPLLIYAHSCQEYIKTLTNIGIRFTKRRYEKALNKYVKNLEPDNVLYVIDKYQCIENQLFTKQEDREILCNYFTLNISLQNYPKYNNKRVFKRLPIWPTHILDSEVPICKSISDTFVYLVPLGTVSSKPFTFFPQNHRGIFYYEVSNFRRKLLATAGAKIRNRLDYFKETIVDNMKKILPQQRNSYTELLIEIDLNDRDHPILQLVYNYSNRFLPKCIQDNQECLKVLEEIGFVRKVTPEIFIKCAKYIQELFKNRKDNKIEIGNFRYSASTTLCYFYNNQSTLKFSENEWEELSKIKFVPISKNFLKYPYSYSSKKNVEELECFENLCLSKYKNFAWTQLAFFENEPIEEVTKIYENFGQPTIQNIINHLRAIQSTVSKSKDWEQRGDELFEIIKQIYEKLESLCDERNDELKSFFPNDLPLFLNGENPLDSESWIIASYLDLNIKKDFKPERRATTEYLKKYNKLLILAGAKASNLPKNKQYGDYEENNSQYIIKSMIDSLCIGENITRSNNVLFYIKEQKFYADSSILGYVAPYFKRSERFSFTFNDIEPGSCHILLRWLYGESLSQAISYIRKKEDEDGLIQIYKDLLQLANEFELESLKQLIEHKLSAYLDISLNENTLNELKTLAQNNELIDLLDYCNMLEKEYC
ncbi:9278_t:CDS:2 [Cetraspora pellucida]|uniref:9278_t:CDS:1 n=1 Tax=Cetraspora pellucida TaxID=1433469 RepID=A0A9N9B9Q8_9GLOM|nr:9278_t:CDS:2 [Cetraspora pellucida]